MDKIHNLYITSQTNKNDNTNYNYNLYFSNYGIQIQPDEDAYLNITSFQTLINIYFSEIDDSYISNPHHRDVKYLKEHNFEFKLRKHTPPYQR